MFLVDRQPTRKPSAKIFAMLDREGLHQYFDRIRLDSDARDQISHGKPSLEALTSICAAHSEAIPFENLDLVRLYNFRAVQFVSVKFL